MSTPKPREGCAWTEERCEQFDKLEQLVAVVLSLNNRSDFLGHVKECIDLADELRRVDFENRKSSFIGFLREQIIEDRSPKGEA